MASSPILHSAIHRRKIAASHRSGRPGRRLMFESLEDRRVLAPLLIVDDGDAGHSQSGAWTNYGTAGFAGDLRYAAAGSGTSTATWSFSDLSPGQDYLVLATWIPHANRATNSPFSVYNGTAVPGNLVATTPVNQRLTPGDIFDSGAGWKQLAQLTVSGSTATVQLTNAANGYVIADAVALQPVTGPPPGSSWIIDDGDLGYSQLGSWTSYSSGGFGGDLDYAPSGSGCCVATWQFDGLTPAVSYDVYATWLGNTNRATDAPFSLYDGTAGPGNLVTTVPIDQQMQPDDFFDSGAWWEYVGQLTPTGPTLSVRLTDDANGFVIADAIQVRQPTALTVQQIAVLDGAVNIPNNTGSSAFGSTAIGSPLTKVFTVQNQGQQPLLLTQPISVPAGFTVTGFGQTTLGAGESTTFSVTLTALVAGNFSGLVSFDNNDPDDNPFAFTVSGTVTNVALPGAIIIDNGGPGHSAVGLWHNWPYGGHDGDVAWAAPRTCSFSTWSFTGLTPGLYRVSATWLANTNRATNAQFEVYDGAANTPNLLATILVNQQMAPNDFTDAGSSWEDLGAGIFSITGSILTVTLADKAANGYVIADAIRIQPVAPLLAVSSDAGVLVSTGARSLGADDLQPLLQAAIGRWDATGLASEQLDYLQSVSVQIGDLPDGVLGVAGELGIVIDYSADGRGWFVDPTPWDDFEFLTIEHPVGVDLLTVLTHELGHMLGYPDGHDSGDEAITAVMGIDALAPGTRVLPGGLKPAVASPWNEVASDLLNGADDDWDSLLDALASDGSRQSD